MEKKRLTGTSANNGLVKKQGFTPPPQSVTGVKMLNYETRARVLEASAKVLEKEMDAMRRDAARLRARSEDKRRHRELQDIWKKVAELVAGGLTEDNAISSIAAHRATTEAQIRYWVQWALDNRTGARRWHRDREIMRLASLGYTNKEIAAHPVVDQWNGGSLHEKSVSRIISRKLGRK